MNGFAENEDKETALKRNIESLLSRKSTEFYPVQAASLNTDSVTDMERENLRLQRLLGELLLKNQQLRAELAGRESADLSIPLRFGGDSESTQKT